MFLSKSMLRTGASQLSRRALASSSSSACGKNFSTEAAANTSADTRGDPNRNIVLVDGVRIPFCTSGTTYEDHLCYDLGRLAIKGLIDKTAIDANVIDYVLFGTVVQEVRTSNLARECALGAGIPNTCPSSTVTQACISSNQAIASAAEKILAGKASVVIAGGAETFSDVPIRYKRALRKRLLKANKAMKKGPMGIVKLMSGLKGADLAPEPPAIANFATGEVMGHSSDRLASRFGVSRDEQDAFAMRSHVNAAKAHADGFYDGEVIPVNGSTEENGIRGESTMESLGKLKAAFVKPHGTHTAANSSFLTDGAAATLIMTEAKAKELGYTPKAILRDWTFVSVDPFEEMLLGPAYAVSRILKQNNMSIPDIDVWEIHEAFAGQVLSNLNALDSDAFAKENLSGRDGRDAKVGEIPRDAINTRGGSLSVGHPFGATGARLATTAANRMIAEDKSTALVTACADSGIGTAMLLERY